MATWLVVLVVGLPWLGALALVFTSDRQPRLQNTLAVAFAAAAAVCSLALIPFAGDEAALTIPLGSVFGSFTLIPDGLGVFLSAVATVIGCLAVIFSIDYMRGEEQLGRYYSLVLLFIGAMAGLVLSGSLLFLFIFWEITALCSYALIAFDSDNPAAVIGGIKALIMTQFGGIGLLAGALIVNSALGTYEIGDFLANTRALPVPLLGIMGFGCLAAAAAKSAQVPFHTWLPGAMEAPTPISALIHAATMVNAGVYLLARFYPAFAEVPGWTTAVIAVGVVTALLAALMAIAANDLKRVLAYSTISQLGYMVYAVGVGGVFASQFHLLSHAVFKALLFLGAGAIIHTVGTRDMRQMGGLRKHMPLTFGVFLIGALALAGIPILNGFWSKDLIIEAGAEGPAWAYAGVLIGVALTALYSFRMVWMVFYGEPRTESHVHDAQPAMQVALIPLAIGSLVTWLLVAPFGRLLADTLPFHSLHVITLPALFEETLRGAMITLPVIAVGLALWALHRPLGPVTRLLGWLERAASADFGFEWINQIVVSGARATASALRTTQTGQLNWNALGILAALILVLAFLLVGGV